MGQRLIRERVLVELLVISRAFTALYSNGGSKFQVYDPCDTIAFRKLMFRGHDGTRNATHLRVYAA